MALKLTERYLKYFFEPFAESFEEGFWEAVKRRELVFQRCNKCGTYLHPPRPMCYKCKSYDLKWEKSNGKGKIYSWVVFTREVNPLYAAPFEVVLVEMDDAPGVRMISNMLDTDPYELEFDMPVEVDFLDVPPKHVIPVFRKAKG